MASEKMKTRYYARATGHDFHEGDKVWFMEYEILQGTLSEAADPQGRCSSIFRTAHSLTNALGGDSVVQDVGFRGTMCLTRNCKNQNDAPGLRALVPAPELDDKDMHRTCPHRRL
ncbi:hypothetical protein TNCV_1683371 [Trichonephila clavipes]|nr:hypothetical protein TNCV_1683371 [Trichonephila clavipes]